MLYRNACTESFLYAPVVNGARIWFVSSHYHWLWARHQSHYFFGEVEEQQWTGKGRRENFQRRFSARTEAPMVRETGTAWDRENLAITSAYERPFFRTNSWGGKVASQCHLLFPVFSIKTFLIALELTLRLNRNQLAIITRMVLSGKIQELNYEAPLLGLAKSMCKSFLQGHISLLLSPGRHDLIQHLIFARKNEGYRVWRLIN